jgi:hypothetical protein
MSGRPVRVDWGWRVVWVSLNIFWSEKARPSFEANMLCDIKDRLHKFGIRQR